MAHIRLVSFCLSVAMVISFLFFLFFLLIDDVAGEGATTATTGGDKLPVSDIGLNVQRLGVAPVTQKLSTTSSTTSIERSSFCARLYQKCQVVCCICTPHYL